MTLPKISIITPSYNQGKYIEQTIVSVIEQNYPNLEYILIDGGSNDNSIEIINKFKHKIDYFISQKDKGQSDAINKGFRYTTGEIIAWLNSDDMYLPNTLQNVAQIFIENPEVDLIYGDVEQFYENGTTEYYAVKDFEPLDFLSRVSIHQPSVFWRRKIMNDTGLLDETLHYLMDYDLWMRIYFNYKTLKVNKLLSRFRIHNQSKTNNNTPLLYLEYRKVFSRFIHSYSNYKYEQKLKSLNIYDNDENFLYKFKCLLSENIIKQAFLNYIINCIKQEYSWGNIRAVNKLILNHHNPLNINRYLSILIKNNLGIGYFKNKWIK